MSETFAPNSSLSQGRAHSALIQHVRLGKASIIPHAMRTAESGVSLAAKTRRVDGPGERVGERREQERDWVDP